MRAREAKDPAWQPTRVGSKLVKRAWGLRVEGTSRVGEAKKPAKP
jgi:hypothetical protein